MLLATERSGSGIPTVLLHGLTATRRYVVMGSTVLQRSGHDVLAYDARGHGESDPAPDSTAYTYDDLACDLLDQLDRAGFERAVLAGASMGAHTIARFALDHPERVIAAVLITPAFMPGGTSEADLARWDARAEGLRRGGIDGFLQAAPDLLVDGPHRDALERVIRQRLSQHRNLSAVADSLQAVPRSEPFSSLTDLAALHMPVLVVADRDDRDPGHPLAVGEAWAGAIPGAELVVEAPGQSPIAWQGGALSRRIAELATRAGAT